MTPGHDVWIGTGRGNKSPGYLAMELAREDHLPPVGFLIGIAQMALFMGNKLARFVGARDGLVALSAD